MTSTTCGERLLVVVYTDPGTDDALALYTLLKAQDLGLIDLLAIMCVRGNTSLDNAARNTLRVLESVNRLDVPVYKGASEPIVVEPKPTSTDGKNTEPHTLYHGHDGFGDAPFPADPDLSLIREELSVEAYLRLSREHKGKLNILCLGPLTNVALAIKSDPGFISRIQHMYIMGGNTTARGNVTSSAEFNFHCDPEAAHAVFANDVCPITLMPWEACRLAAIPYEWRCDVMGKAGSKQADLLNMIEENLMKVCSNPLWTPCDFLIVAVMLQPNIATLAKTCHLTVELHGARTRGQAVIDHLNRHRKNVTLVETMDGEAVKQLLLLAVDHPQCTLKF